MPSVEVIDSCGQNVQKTYYIYGEHIGFDEDFTHEYKGHVNFSHDEVPSWAKETRYERASRQPVSRLELNFCTYDMNQVKRNYNIYVVVYGGTHRHFRNKGRKLEQEGDRQTDSQRDG